MRFSMLSLSTSALSRPSFDLTLLLSIPDSLFSFYVPLLAFAVQPLSSSGCSLPPPHPSSHLPPTPPLISFPPYPSSHLLPLHLQTVSYLGCYAVTPPLHCLLYSFPLPFLFRFLISPFLSFPIPLPPLTTAVSRPIFSRTASSPPPRFWPRRAVLRRAALAQVGAICARLLLASVQQMQMRFD